MVQLLQNLADEFADFAQGMVRGNPLLRLNVREHPALILKPSAHLQSSRRIKGELNHHPFALARFFSKLLVVFCCGREGNYADREFDFDNLVLSTFAARKSRSCRG